MTKRSNSGQLLPLLSIVLVFLIVFVGANMERSLLGIEKIRNQKTTDMLAMEATGEQARALNAIAALNNGYDVIIRNVSIYAGVLVGLGICAAASAATLFGAAVSPCVHQFRILMQGTPEFLKKVNKLGTIMGKWQDELVKWGEKTPYRTLQVFNAFEILDSYAFLYPTEPKLRIHRSDNLNMDNKTKCEVRENPIYPLVGSNPANPNDPMGAFSSLHLGADDFLELNYRDIGGSNETITFQPEKGPKPYQIKVGTSTYQFANAIIHRCESFYSIVGGLRSLGSGILQLPGYMVLDEDYAENQRITIGLLRHTAPTVVGNIDRNHLKEHEAFTDLLGKIPFTSIDLIKAIRATPHWSIAESKVTGLDYMNMSFEGSLAKVTQAVELRDHIYKDSKALKSIPIIKDVPNFLIFDKKEVHEKMAH